MASKPSILKRFGQIFREVSKRGILTTNSGFHEMTTLARVYKRFGKNEANMKKQAHR